VRPVLVAVAMAGLVVLAGCAGAPEDESTADSEREIQDIPEIESGAPEIQSPQVGDEVDPTFVIQMDPGPIDVSGDTEVADAGGKFHILVDQGCLENGESFPPIGPDHLVFEEAQTQLVATLEEGAHELCLQFGNLFDVAYYATDSVTIRVVS
jgi:hypothetical protein